MANDYSWIRGANYIPSYAITSVDIWRDFDASIIDRELGFAARLRLNSIRIFLQYHVYELLRAEFLRNVETFVSLCAKHGIRPMLIVFDGCFGVSPSITSTTWWVAGPGGPQTNPSFYPEGEKYCRDLAGLFRGDPRLLMWDAMNEPEAVSFYTGKQQAYDFAKHFAEYFHEIDHSHPITIGFAHGENNQHAVDVVDVVSFHPYASSREDLTKRLIIAREVAAGKPVLATETGMPFWNCPYELVLPFFREQKIGWYFYELMIGRDAFATTGGIFYPDGTVRRLRQVEAVLGHKAEGFAKKPDKEGIPMAPMPGSSVLHAGQLDRLTATPMDEENIWERFTFLWSIANPFNISSEDAARLEPQINEIRAQMEKGNTRDCSARIWNLLQEARHFHWNTQPLMHPEVLSLPDEEGPT